MCCCMSSNDSEVIYFGLSCFWTITVDHWVSARSLFAENIKYIIICGGAKYERFLLYADWWHSFCLSLLHCLRQMYVLPVIFNTMSQNGFLRERAPSLPPNPICSLFVCLIKALKSAVWLAVFFFFFLLNQRSGRQRRQKVDQREKSIIKAALPSKRDRPACRQ